MQDSNDPARRYGLVQRQMPTGCRFAPSDEVLVIHYLSKKGKNEPLPCPYAVRECDLYGREPGEIWREFGGDRLKRKIDQELGLLFFTRLKIRRSVALIMEAQELIGVLENGKGEGAQKHQRTVSWTNQEAGPSFFKSNKTLESYDEAKRNSSKEMVASNSTESGRGDAGVENGNDQGAQKRQRTDSWTNQEAAPSFFNSNKTLESYEAKRHSTVCGKEMGSSIDGGHSFDLNIEWNNPDEDDTYTSHKERQPHFSSGKKMTEIASSSLASLVTDSDAKDDLLKGGDSRF
ncbi:hypothetical protein POTOM_001735 [Populus tomentosa]|uniref:NAC domain-containing protein n=1 Tax=Populus tomentosa TaxID=118781 RepID=A0A8X8DIK6_POPTO|nr:hypothetical protein POTOM_001735 [Populus tomentosa]